MYSIKTAALVAFGLVASIACLAPAAHAQLTFATFANSTANNFRYDAVTNTFFSTPDGVNPGAVNINFRYNVNTAYAPQFTNIAASLNFSATGASSVDGDLFLPMSGINMTITATTPGPNGSNLLSLTGDGRIRGTANSNSIPVSGDSVLGNTVNFTSDYVVATDTQSVFALTTSDASPNYAVNGVTGRPNSFTGTYVGTFSNAIVPEANTGLLAALALPLLGGIAVLRRRTAK